MAQAVATKHLALLQQLPPIFAALLLNEIVTYDWKFPAEQADIDRQLHFLSTMSETQLHTTMAGFADLPLSDAMQQDHWAAAPEPFVEKLTAYLWSVHQMDRFHEIAEVYQQTLLKAEPEPAPEIPRLCIVVVGKGATPGTIKLFQKLRPHGTYFTQVKPAGALDTLFAAVEARAQSHPASYKHWYVDGGAPYPRTNSAEHPENLITISYASLAPLRSALLDKVNTVRTSGDVVGPESLRSLLASLQPGQLKAAETSHDPTLQHFELNLLTEGSGTQIFSTTFVQWAGRELLRRARPLTLVLRYAPRQMDRPMNEMLRADAPKAQDDPNGSLVDADMGAYYTWINLMRLNGAEKASFIVWFEDQQEALAIAPAMPQGSESTTPCDMSQILHWTA
nr:hypothetical protein [Granulicella arctica]